MSSFRQYLDTAASYASEEVADALEWSAVGGRWSVAHAMTLLAGVSFLLWLLVLMALL